MKRLFLLFLLCVTVSAIKAQTSDSTAVDLKEVVVKGERPMKKIKGNVVAYDANVLRERFQPTTAFGLLEHVPEIVVKDDAVSLVGSQSVLLVIDGRVNLVDAALVTERLKALPAEQVAAIEISRVAPAKFNFTGALINVRTVGSMEQLTTLTENQLSQTRRTSDNGRASLMFDKGRLSLFGAASYGYSDSRSDSYYKMADGYRCDTEVQNYRNSLRLNGEAGFLLGKNTKLTADYYGYSGDETRKDFRQAQNIRDSETPASQASQTFIRSRRLTDDRLHSFGLELSLPWQLSISARYKNFSSPYTQYYGTAVAKDAVKMALVQTSSQDINNWRTNLNKDFNLGKSATLSAGITHDFTTTALSVDYGNSLVLGAQKEWNTAVYAQTAFRLWKKLDVTLGLRAEKTKQLYRDKATGEEKTVWNDFWLFPTLQLSLPLNDKGHAMQLSLQSRKEFPGYWWISPQTTVIDERSLSVGNPDMRPSRTYQLALYYFFGSDWTIGLSGYYTKDGLARLPHYDAHLGKTIYTGENYDLDLQPQLFLQYSKTIGRYTTTALASGGYSFHRINDYYGKDYKSRSFDSYIAWYNDFRQPLGHRFGTLFLHADLSYMMPMKNAFTLWSDTWSFNAHARWQLSHKFQAEFGLCNILRLGQMRWTKIEIPGQEIYETHYNPRTAYLKLSLTLGKQRRMKQPRDDMDHRFGR